MLSEFAGALADGGGGELCEAHHAVTRARDDVRVSGVRHEFGLKRNKKHVH